ncbi:MAG: histidine kinase, partial [Candidatus Aureabacteria bacterium]|nr:histidine kinase [Candidatus Auribacterota bacterium]
FLNFNGSAGIWRRSAIEDAGGWEGDTLTEDLDLSFRAQLKGWKFSFVGDHEAPAELPVSMDAIRSQQFRWCKGPAENVRKNFLAVLRSELPLPIKIHACFHLLNSSVFVCLLVATLLSVPLLIVQVRHPELNPVFRYSSVFIISMVCVTLFYWSSRRRSEMSLWRQAVAFILTYPVFLCISMGFSLHNGIAVLEGYLGKKTPFIRTPKFNIRDLKESWNENAYVSGRISFLTLIEGLLALYFLGGAVLAFYYDYYALLPVHLMLFLGYGMIFVFSIRHAHLAHTLALRAPARG